MSIVFLHIFGNVIHSIYTVYWAITTTNCTRTELNWNEIIHTTGTTKYHYILLIMRSSQSH